MSEFRYEWDKFEDMAKSKELGRRFFKDRVVCRFIKAGGDLVFTVWQDGKINPAFEQAHFRPRSMDRIDVENAKLMRDIFDEFMKAGEQKDEGFPVREWSAVTRAEAENLVGLGLTTLEKLAKADDALLRDFTGGRVLKEKAQAWLDDAKDKGIMISKNEVLKRELEEAKEMISDLKAQLANTLKQVDALTEKATKTKEK